MQNSVVELDHIPRIFETIEGKHIFQVFRTGESEYRCIWDTINPMENSFIVRVIKND